MTTEEEKRKNWEWAQALTEMGDCSPSAFMLDLVEQEIKGEITKADIKKALDEKYKSN